MAPKLAVATGTLGLFDGRAVKPAPKTAAPIYASPEFRAWRGEVIRRAGRRCEAVEAGVRCHKREPTHRMFADHIVEVSDGGAKFDATNGQCLCGAHHTAKTAQARAARRAP